MADTVKHKKIRVILIVIEILAVLAFLGSVPVINSGNIAGISVCLFLLLITVFWDKTEGFRHNKIGRIVTGFVAFFLIAGFGFAGFLTFKMVRACLNHPGKPNCIVVLGCQLWGENPSPMLQKRLDKAYDLLIKYPDVPVVVTGGQGDDEVISEGEGMKRYLVRRGISEERIIVEDKSTSTYENIKNAFEMTDKMGLSRDITIATSEYHMYRASLIAKSQGAGQVTSAPSYTDFNLVPTFWVREWLGLSHFFVFGT